jgi:hypothetical protein
MQTLMILASFLVFQPSLITNKCIKWQMGYVDEAVRGKNTMSDITE